MIARIKCHRQGVHEYHKHNSHIKLTRFCYPLHKLVKVIIYPLFLLHLFWTTHTFDSRLTDCGTEMVLPQVSGYVLNLNLKPYTTDRIPDQSCWRSRGVTMAKEWYNRITLSQYNKDADCWTVRSCVITQCQKAVARSVVSKGIQLPVTFKEFFKTSIWDSRRDHPPPHQPSILTAKIDAPAYYHNNKDTNPNIMPSRPIMSKQVDNGKEQWYRWNCDINWVKTSDGGSCKLSVQSFYYNK